MPKLVLDIGKMLQAAQGLPALMGELPDVPMWLQKYGPAIAKGAGLASQFIDNDNQESGGMPDLPALGPTGNGRETYLKNKHQWTDEQVSLAASAILNDDNAPPQVSQMAACVEDMLNAQGESMEGGIYPSHAKMRVAIDMTLQSKSLNQGVRARLGDMLMFTLKAQRRTK